MSAEVVPFGKYKGQPVEVMAADADYCEWLTAQPWFKAKYGNVYNLVINYGAEPQDSPEHNQMQAAFLDDAWCFALADVLRPQRKDTYGDFAARELLDADPLYKTFWECVDLECSPAGVSRRFENHGWDVTYSIDPASITTHRTRLVPPLPPCSCRCDHAQCGDDAPCHGGSEDRHWRCDHRQCPAEKKRGIGEGDHCTKGCYWASSYKGGSLTNAQREWLKSETHFFAPYYGGTFMVELKPDLGDDYPTVLRQVTRYPWDGPRDKRCVIARRHAFEHVTWEQVRKIFAASQIQLLAESEIRPAVE